MSIPLIVDTPINSGLGTTLQAAAANSLNPTIILANAINAPPPSGDTMGVIDHTNLTAYFNAVAADSTGNARLCTLFGQYYINQKIVITMQDSSNIEQGPMQIVGYGQTTINVVGTNLGCIEFQTPLAANCHHISIENIGINYQTQQTSSDTASVALGFRTIAGTDTGGTIFEIFVDRLLVIGAFRGIANTQTSGKFAIWGLAVTRCDFGNMAGAGIWMASPTSVGQPNMKFDHVYYTSYAGGSEATCRVDGCDALKISNWEVNKLTNQNVFNITAAWFTIDRCKIETCTYSASTNNILQFANSAGLIDGFSFENVTLTASNLYLVDSTTSSASASISLSNIVVTVLSGTGTLTLVGGTPTIFIFNDIPYFSSLGTGPAVARLVYSGGSANSNYLRFNYPPGGGMSDDYAQSSITTLAPLTTPSINVWNTPLTANVTVNLAAALGTVVADNCWDSATFTFVRTANATGSSTFTISGAIPSTRTLTAGQSSTWSYRRSLGGFVETSFGTA